MQIWRDLKGRGRTFTCHGNNHADTCDRFDLGLVGNDQTESIRCTCPREFDFVEYDIPMDQWKMPESTKDAGIEIDTVYVNNTCNPAEVGPNVCTTQQAISLKACFKNHSLNNY